MFSLGEWLRSSPHIEGVRRPDSLWLARRILAPLLQAKRELRLVRRRRDAQDCRFEAIARVLSGSSASRASLCQFWAIESQGRLVHQRSFQGSPVALCFPTRDISEPLIVPSVSSASQLKPGVEREQYTRRMRGASLRWLLLGLILLALILVPFVLFEARFLETVERLLHADSSRLVVIAGVSILLASDVILPVPSSVVATASGMLLGVAQGAIVTWVGMQAGALVGYGLGRSAGVRATTRFVGEAEIERASRLHRRWGAFSLIAARAVPVLAESSVVLAGAVRMPLGQFAWLTGVSNAAIALVYASVGTHALESSAFLFAFVASMAIPGAVMWIHHVIERRAAAGGSRASGSAEDSGAETLG